ncbi:sulfatase-like hydrolase/transferase, partial [bacterium]|nr:sulfatase-like hydrolase/transferase [bacterium]
MKATAVSGRGVSVLYPLLLGAVEGGIAGLVEAAVMIRRGSNLVSPGDLFPVAFFHLVLWGVVGLALGLVVKALVLVRRRRPRPEDEKAFHIASVSFLVVLVTVGAHMNVFVLPEMLSRISILFDFLLLLACLALGFALFRLARRRIAGRGLRPGSPLVVAGIVLTVALVVAAAARPGDGRGEEAQGVPKVGGLNVILIVPDALRPDHLGCYGYERRTSPAIDRLAAEGQLFLEAYAHAPLTKQSTATMVTSLYPSTHNVLYLEDALPESATLLMEEASKGNLRTAVFSANPLISPFFGFGRGVDFFYFERIPVMRRTVLGQASMALGFRVPRLLCVRR